MPFLVITASLPCIQDLSFSFNVNGDIVQGHVFIGVNISEVIFILM